MKQEVIIGIHSILEALRNPERGSFRLFTTEEGLSKFKAEFRDYTNYIKGDSVITIKNKHEFQKVAAQLIEENGFRPSRVMNGIFLLASSRKFVQVGEVFDKLKDKRNLKVICLDQVTDPQNAACNFNIST